MPDLIDEIISPSAFKQLDDAIGKLVDCRTEVNNLAAAAKTITFDFKVPKDLSNLTDLINRANAATASMTVAQNNLNQSTANYNTVSALYTKNVQEGADALAQQRLELSYVDSQLKQLTKDIQEGNGNIDKNNEKLAMWTRRQQELKVEIGATTTALKSEIKENYAAADSMDAMSQKLGQMREQYRALTNAQRSSSFGKQLQKDIYEADKSLKDLDQSIGNSQRNVGNYSSALDRMGESFGKIGQFITRDLLRGIASGIVFSLVFENLSKLWDYFTKLTPAEEAAADRVKKYTDNLKELSDTIKTGIADTTIESTVLKDNSELQLKIATNTKNGMDARIDAYNKLSTIMPQVLKNYTAEDVLSGKASAAIMKQADSVAYYQASIAQAEKEYRKLLQVQEDNKEKLAKARTPVQKEYAEDVIAQMQMRIDAAKLGIQMQQETLANLVAPLPTTKKAKTKKGADMTNETLKAERDLTKELYNEYAKRLMIDAEYQRAIAEDEKNSLTDRVIAYQKYTDLIFRAKAEQLSGEYTENEQSLAKIAEIEKKAVKDRTKEQQDLVISKEVLLQKQNTLIAEYDLLQVKSAADTEKGLQKIYDDEVKYRITALQKIAVNNDQQMQDELEGLRHKYGTGLMSEQVYQEKVKQIKEKYAIQNDNDQIAYLKDQIDNLAKQGVDVSALNKSLADAEDKLRKDQAAKEDDANNKRAEGIRKVKDLSIQLATEIASAYIASQDAMFDYQSLQLDKQQKKEQLYYDQQRRAIEASVGYQQDKANKLQDLNAQQTAQENEIAQKQKEVARAKAKFDRDASIANIIAKTAEAIAATLPLYANPATVPFAIAQDVLIGAIGAAQIAKASSTPLPAYKLGTHSHRGGLFIAGDGNEPEFIKAPGKEGYWSNNVSTLYNEGAGTKVIPLSKMVNTIHSSNASTHNGYQQAITSNDTAMQQIAKMISKEFQTSTEGLAWVISKSKPVINIKTESSKTRIDNY
jgi:hypothetical protein